MPGRCRIRWIFQLVRAKLKVGRRPPWEVIAEFKAAGRIRHRWQRSMGLSGLI